MHTAFRAAAAAIAIGAASPAAADLVLNMVVVDLVPGQPPRADIEASNTGSERIYVVAEPAEIVNPGRPDERRVASPDPAALGLLVTPQKMILEPGERKLVRIAAIAPPARTDRIYRVTIKPVAGDVSAATSALKILVGYDVLVIARPAVMTGTVTATRTGASMTLANTGTTNVELYEGRQCDPAGKNCAPLPSRRLYAGATWTIAIDPARPVDYKVKTGNAVAGQRF